MTVAEAQERMSHREFVEWCALEEVEPSGYLRQDIHAALVASTMANCFSKKKLDIKDFLLKFGEEPEISSPAEMEMRMKQLAAAFRASGRLKEE